MAVNIENRIKNCLQELIKVKHIQKKEHKIRSFMKKQRTLLHDYSASNMSESKELSQPKNNALLKQAYQQISQMQKVIEQLRKENLQLKQQLIKEEKKQKKQHTQELEVLKKGSGCQNLNLQKQIQTLKALQSLQLKLRKSISKKQKLCGLKNNRVVQVQHRKG